MAQNLCASLEDAGTTVLGHGTNVTFANESVRVNDLLESVVGACDVFIPAASSAESVLDKPAYLGAFAAGVAVIILAAFLYMRRSDKAHSGESDDGRMDAGFDNPMYDTMPSGKGNPVYDAEDEDGLYDDPEFNPTAGSGYMDVGPNDAPAGTGYMDVGPSVNGPNYDDMGETETDDDDDTYGF